MLLGMVLIVFTRLGAVSTLVVVGDFFILEVLTLLPISIADRLCSLMGGC